MVGVLVFAIRVVLGAQTTAGDTGLRFEVTSVRPNDSGANGGGVGLRGGRLTASNATPLDMIRWSFQLEPYRITGAPSWAASERFDAAGTAGISTPLNIASVQEMTRAFLADRFKLKVHFETRPLQGYALVRLKNDVLGSDLKKSAVDCAALQRRGELSVDPPPRSVEDFSKPPTCGSSGGAGFYAAGGVTMRDLVALLKEQVNANVTDRTGLEGGYTMRLRWNPDPTSATNLAADAFLPTIFVALEDQLGLRLERRTEPTEILVIDSIERPTPD